MNKPRSTDILLMMVAALSATAMSSCNRVGAEAQQAKPAVAIPTVAVAKVKRADLSSKLALNAEFEPYQEVDVMAKVSGYLREIKVDIGDRVKAGQVLATLEIPEMQDDLAKASATIDEANAELATARDDLTRAESSRDMTHLSYSRILDVSKREPGLVPQQEVDEAHSRDLVAEAQVSSAKSLINESEQRIRVSKADESRVKTLQKYTVITAPFDGVVTKRYANEGAMIQAGTTSQTQAMPVVRVSQNGRLRLILPVPESAVAGIRLGEVVTARVSALNRTFAGHVTRFADKLWMSTRTMDTEVDVPNSDLLLIPGMYAEVDLVLLKHPHALTVPPDAIEGAGSNSQRVYVVDANHAIHIVPVTTGLEDSQRVEILSGLREGDAVVVGRHADLADGEQVQPKLDDFDTDTGASTQKGT
jgi:RND family efflux transporter MFP subunit